MTFETFFLWVLLHIYRNGTPAMHMDPSSLCSDVSYSIHKGTLFFFLKIVCYTGQHLSQRNSRGAHGPLHASPRRVGGHADICNASQ